MSFNEFHPNSKPLFVMAFLDIPSLLDLISTASNLRSDTGLRSWLASRNSDSRDFAFVKRTKNYILEKKIVANDGQGNNSMYIKGTLIFSFNLYEESSMFKRLLNTFDLCTYRKVICGNLIHLDITYWSFSLSDI